MARPDKNTKLEAIAECLKKQASLELLSYLRENPYKDNIEELCTILHYSVTYLTKVATMLQMCGVISKKRKGETNLYSISDYFLPIYDFLMENV